MNHVLFISGLDGDTRRYRCLHHQEQLNLHGIASTLRQASDRQLYVDVTTCDLLILHRVAWSGLIADVVQMAHLRGKPVLFETDDLVFAPELHDKIAFLDTLPPEAAQRFRQDLLGQARTFAECDDILCTTQYLADAASQRGKVAFIQRNACSTEMLRAAEAAYRLREHTKNQVVIGYFSGTGSHNRDFAQIVPVLLDLLRRYPQVEVHLSGYLALDSRFYPYADRIRRTPYVAWQELPHLIAQVDINLAPLELDNPFCQAKSEIKWSEAALVGIPTVASPTEAFVHAIQPGETGLLAATADEWLAALTRLIEEPAERQRLGENARQQVYYTYTPEARSQELLATLRQIVQNYPAAQAAPDQVAPALAQTMLRHLQQLEQQQQQQGRQLEQLRQALSTWQSNKDEAREEWRRRYEAATLQHQATLRDLLARLQARGT